MFVKKMRETLIYDHKSLNFIIFLILILIKVFNVQKCNYKSFLWNELCFS
jgi:hypothetical protein